MNFPFDRPIVLENERVQLRLIEPSDVAHLLPVSSADQKLLQYSPAQIHTQEFLADYIASALKEKEKRRRYPFIIYDKLRKSYAGSTSFMSISQPNKRLEIGSTWIGKDFQRTGLNRHCKFLLLHFAFEEAQAERVEFLTDERNLQSRTAIEKIGAKFEGILRSHITMLDGFRRSSVSYSIIREEWPQVKQMLGEAIRK